MTLGQRLGSNDRCWRCHHSQTQSPSPSSPLLFLQPVALALLSCYNSTHTMLSLSLSVYLSLSLSNLLLNSSLARLKALTIAASIRAKFAAVNTITSHQVPVLQTLWIVDNCPSVEVCVCV